MDFFLLNSSRSSPPEVFLGKGVLKICSKFTGEQLCQSVISIKLLCNFIESTLWYRCSPVNLLHIFRTPVPKNTSRGLIQEEVSLNWFYIFFLHLFTILNVKHIPRNRENWGLRGCKSIDDIFLVKIRITVFSQILCSYIY